MISTCTILCAETGDSLITVAVPNARDFARLLDKVTEAARRIDGIRSARLLSFEVGPDVLCRPMEVSDETAAAVWMEIRGAFVSVAVAS